MKSKPDKSLFVDLIKKVMQDSTYKDREPLRRAARDAAAPVLQDLHSAGVDVGELNALRSNHPQIDAAIPILVRWLPLLENPLVRMTIVRRLSIPKARGLASKVFLREFNKIKEPNDSLKWVLGNGLSLTADHEDLPELMRIAGDAKHGRAREMIVSGLAAFDEPRVRALLVSLLNDDDVNGHAIVALRKLGASEAKPFAQRLLTDKRAWVRREARKLIALGQSGKTQNPDSLC